MTDAVARKPHCAVGWVYIGGIPGSPRAGARCGGAGVTRWPTCWPGGCLGCSPADRGVEVLARLEVPESGWLDLADLRTRGRVWLKEHLAGRAGTR